MKTAVVGGGAAGFFLAVNLKEMMPDMQVTGNLWRGTVQLYQQF